MGFSAMESSSNKRVYVKLLNKIHNIDQLTRLSMISNSTFSRLPRLFIILQRTLSLICFLSYSVFLLGQPKNIYVSSHDGIDSNSGLTAILAIKTLDALQGLALNGDTIHFKRGNVWRGEQWYNPRTDLIIKTYDSGAKPILTNLDTIELAMDPQNWSLVNNNWEVTITKPPARLLLDGDEVLRSVTKDKIGVPDSIDSIVYCFAEKINDTTTILYLKVDDNPANKYLSIEGSSLAFTVTFYGADNCAMDSIDIRGGNTYSLWLANTDSTLIRNCDIGSHGRGGLILSRGSDNNLISDCLFDSKFTQFYGYTIGGIDDTDRGVGDGINIRNNASHNTIVNCDFRNWSHNALEIVHDTPSHETDTAVVANYNKFLYNTIDAIDIPYAHPFGADGPIDSCAHNEWAYNIVTNCRTAIQVNGNNNIVHNNIIGLMKQSPAKTIATANAFICAVYEAYTSEDDFLHNVSENNIFENNLIYDTDEAAIRIDDFGYEDRAVKNITFRNNLIVNSGLNPIGAAYDKGTAIYFDDIGIIDSIQFENNLFYQDTLPNEILYLANSSQYVDFDSFNIINYEFGIKSTDNLNEDPMLLANIPSDVSIAINSGTNNSSVAENDLLGNVRVIDGVIDIGPYENQTDCLARSRQYVDADATGLGDGSSWINASNTIYDGISLCVGQKSRSIWVAEGIYYPTGDLDSSKSISLLSNTSLYGGFVGDEFDLSQRDFMANETIISGDIGIVNDNSDNSLNVISQSMDTFVVIDGFTVEGGNGGEKGGGINIQNSIASLSNLNLKANLATEGNHIYTKNSLVYFDNIIISENDPSVFDILFDDMTQVIITNFIVTQILRIRGFVRISGEIQGN